MSEHRVRAAGAAVSIALGLFAAGASGQTPEQQKAWDADRERAVAAEKARTEQLARERAARKADPMGWVRTLDPMTSGGWEFRSVAGDGSWAVFSSTHQLKRDGQLVTIWMRHEYAEPQTGEDGQYLSAVEKEEYDCKKQKSRSLMIVYYASNNIQGSQQTEEADAKTAPWSAIIPGTRDEMSFLWACNQARGAR
jgi:surface-adhesin protein E